MGIVMWCVGLPVHANDYSEETAQFWHEAILLCKLRLGKDIVIRFRYPSEPLAIGTSNDRVDRARNETLAGAYETRLARSGARVC